MRGVMFTGGELFPSGPARECSVLAAMVDVIDGMKADLKIEGRREA